MAYTAVRNERLSRERTVQGTNVPGNEWSWERKFHHGNECSRERIVLGTNIPTFLQLIELCTLSEEVEVLFASQMQSRKPSYERVTRPAITLASKCDQQRNFLSDDEIWTESQTKEITSQVCSLSDNREKIWWWWWCHWNCAALQGRHLRGGGRGVKWAIASPRESEWLTATYNTTLSIRTPELKWHWPDEHMHRLTSVTSNLIFFSWPFPLPSDHLSTSDLFTMMALYKSIYLLKSALFCIISIQKPEKIFWGGDTAPSPDSIPTGEVDTTPLGAFDTSIPCLWRGLNTFGVSAPPP